MRVKGFERKRCGILLQRSADSQTKRQRANKKMPVQRSYGMLAVCIALAACLVVFLHLFSHLGGLLNRSRGGYVDFRKAAGNSSSEDGALGLDYWPAEICKNLLFAVPTGVVVLMFGLHFRASLTVLLMTWCSLYIGWGTYMNIGDVPTNYGSRSGVYDWLVGRQEDGNWTYDRRFIREFSGMSLRGLAWTAPQGYLLQLLGFGWEYSLSGSLMGFVYYLGSRTPVDTGFSKAFGAHTAYAEYYWGTWIWFVLIICCLSQVVRRMHIWIFSKKEYLGFRPFSTWEKVKYESLNRLLSRLIYEGFMLFFNLLMMCSLVYYSLVVQEDVRNKGMTFFGLFADVILLTFLQGWSLNLLYLKLKHKWRLRKRATIRVSVNPTGARVVGSPFQSPRASPRIPDLDNFETAAAIASGENKPLMGWNNSQSASPYQTTPILERNHSTLMGNDSPTEPSYRPHLQLGTAEPATTTTAVLILWPAIEKWVWMDVFIWLRRLIGLISIIATIIVLSTCTAALFWNRETRRYLHPHCTYQ